MPNYYYRELRPIPHSATPLYIFDIDGTLALADHRRHLVEAPKCSACNGCGLDSEFYSHEGVEEDTPCRECYGDGLEFDFKPQWDAFYDACDKDLPNRPVIETMRRLWQYGVDIWFFSGRSDRVYDKTVEWLLYHTDLESTDICEGQLVMRPEGDFTPDDQLKQRFLDNMLPADRDRLVAVFEDRTRVVDMWRRNGVACFQVAEGNF